MLSIDSSTHHLFLLAWLSATAKMSQHLASCLRLVLAVVHASGHLQLVYECVQSCQDFRTMRLRGYLRLLMFCEQLLVFKQRLRKGAYCVLHQKYALVAEIRSN